MPLRRAQENLTRRRDQALEQARGVGGAGTVTRKAIVNLNNARSRVATHLGAAGPKRRKKARNGLNATP